MKMATFFCPLSQHSSHSTTTVFEGPKETLRGVILDETVSASLDSGDNSKKAKGGAYQGPVLSCGRVEKDFPLKEGMGVNWGSPRDQGMKENMGGQGKVDDKSSVGQEPDISVTTELAKLKPVLRPEEEGDLKTNRGLKKISP